MILVSGPTGSGHATTLYASVTAGLLSTILALAIFPVVAEFALDFGAAEIFAVIVFAITIIAGVSGDSILKGMIAACFGFLISRLLRFCPLAMCERPFDERGAASRLRYIDRLEAVLGRHAFMTLVVVADAVL